MPLPPGAFWYFGSELAGHHPGRRDIDRHVEHRDRDGSGGVVEREVPGSQGAAAGTNGHGLVVELVLGEGDLWPSNVGNELLGKPAQGGIRTGLRGCASLLHGIYATKNNHSNNIVHNQARRQPNQQREASSTVTILTSVSDQAQALRTREVNQSGLDVKPLSTQIINRIKADNMV